MEAVSMDSFGDYNAGTVSQTAPQTPESANGTSDSGVNDDSSIFNGDTSTPEVGNQSSGGDGEIADALAAVQGEEASESSISMQTIQEGLSNLFSTAFEYITNIFNSAKTDAQTPAASGTAKDDRQGVQNDYTQVQSGLESDGARQAFEKYKEISGAEYTATDDGGFTVTFPVSSDSADRSSLRYNSEGKLTNAKNLTPETLRTATGAEFADIPDSAVCGVDNDIVSAVIADDTGILQSLYGTDGNPKGVVLRNTNGEFVQAENLDYSALSYLCSDDFAANIYRNADGQEASYNINSAGNVLVKVGDGLLQYNSKGNLAIVQNVDYTTLQGLKEMGEAELAGLAKNKYAESARYTYHAADGANYKTGGLYAKLSNGIEREVLSDGSMSYVNYGAGQITNPYLQGLIYYGESGNPEIDKQNIIRGNHNGQIYAATKFDGDNYVFAQMGSDGKVHFVDGGGTPVTGLNEAQKEILRAMLGADEKSGNQYRYQEYTPENGETTRQYTRNYYGSSSTQTQQTQQTKQSQQQTQQTQVYTQATEANDQGISTGKFYGQYDASCMTINNVKVFAVISGDKIHYVDENGNPVSGLTDEQKEALKNVLIDATKK